MSVVVRPAGPDDLAAVLHLLGQLNPEDEALDPGLAAETWREILGWAGVHTLVGCLDQAVGLLGQLRPGIHDGTAPLIAWHQARLTAAAGRDPAAALRRAAAASPDWCFPSRLEELALLTWVAQVAGNSVSIE